VSNAKPCRAQARSGSLTGASSSTLLKYLPSGIRLGQGAAMIPPVIGNGAAYSLPGSVFACPHNPPASL
jgi:hypothetical protein